MEKGRLEHAVKTFRKSLAEIEEIKDKGIRSKLDTLYEDYKIAVESMEIRLKLESFIENGCERREQDASTGNHTGKD